VVRPAPRAAGARAARDRPAVDWRPVGDCWFRAVGGETSCSAKPDIVIVNLMQFVHIVTSLKFYRLRSGRAGFCFTVSARRGLGEERQPPPQALARAGL